jgi:hypothetical protein
MSVIQLSLPMPDTSPFQSSSEELEGLLSRNLDFHDQVSGYASHNFHSFPAKFPPQLPRLFIETLSRPGEVVLDPMQGSGTTILEGLLLGRRPIGFDIDPLALLISRLKTTPLEPLLVLQTSKEILRKARAAYEERSKAILLALESRWNQETRLFIDYWYDYMRAHKFSLVWFGSTVKDLSAKRGTYIGGEELTQIAFEPLPEYTSQIISEISNLDRKKGQVLHRYYSEMTRVLQEMYRVLRPGKSSIVVVGTSQMRSRDTQTQNCLADIGRSLGFKVPIMGVRNLDRDRRMLPVGITADLESQIQQRMHKEYVIGFYKP